MQTSLAYHHKLEFHEHVKSFYQNKCNFVTTLTGALHAFYTNLLLYGEEKHLR